MSSTPHRRRRKPARTSSPFSSSLPEINLVAQAKTASKPSISSKNIRRPRFLDVQMPGLDGSASSKNSSNASRVPHVVFATAFDHYAVQAFDVNAVDYVLKPFDKSRIAKAIARARREMEADTVLPSASKTCQPACRSKATASSAPVNCSSNPSSVCC